MARKPEGELRRGWTTGACATAAARAAYTAYLTGVFPDPVQIVLPKGETPSFALAREGKTGDGAFAAIIKDAGDDPDVTHGALIRVDISAAEPGTGVVFRAGDGVGTVTRDGLALPIGEPAINPIPRKMICQAIDEVASAHDGTSDVIVTVSVEDGAVLAEQTWNPRLGILGGISILGTTGVVVPYSCAAWIESIHRGIDVARAGALPLIAGCTGKSSEASTQSLLDLPDHAMIDMGDFAGGMLKYLRRHPVPQVVIGGGFAKISKLAEGNLDLHSGRSQVDLTWIADVAHELGAPKEVAARIEGANTAAAALSIANDAGLSLAPEIACRAQAVARYTLAGADVEIDVFVYDQAGNLVGRSDE